MRGCSLDAAGPGQGLVAGFCENILNTVVSIQWIVFHNRQNSWGGYTLVTLPRILTPYRDSVDGTRDRVTYQKLVTR